MRGTTNFMAASKRETTQGQILASAILAILILSLVPATRAAPPQFANWSSWNGYMSSIPAPKVGCFKAVFPSTVWQPTQCVVAPHLPLQPLLPSTVGNGFDEVAQAPSGQLIGSSFGSFQSITGLTSEADSDGSTNCGSPNGNDCFGLQDNSNFFSTSTLYTGDKPTTGWEQFVFLNAPGYNEGIIFIQYWLLNYYSQYGSCPSAGPPGGSSWMMYSGHCYANSPASGTPPQTASNLGSLTLNAYADFGSSLDENVICISGGSCYNIAITDQVVDLYQNWQDAEFNVFGYCCGSQANFNSGTSITVVNALNDHTGNAIAPTCVTHGYTGETNDLNLGSCSPSSGQIAFGESNGNTVGNTVTFNTNPTGFLGSAAPGSINACGGTFTNGQASSTCSNSFSATANLPSFPSQWQFDHWEWGGGVSCTSSTANPTSCSVSSSGSLKAVYAAQIAFYTNPSTLGSISWGSCSNPEQTNGQSIFDASLPPEFTDTNTACANVPSGYSFSGWSTGGGLSVSGSTNPATVTVTGPGTLTANFNQPTQTAMTVSYTIIGGGSPSPPVFNYVQGGVSQSYTLTSAPTAIQVDQGTSWSISPNPLAGSSSSERWESNQTLSGTASATTILFSFYHQYSQTLSYSVAGGDSPSAPSFTANQFGAATPEVLASTPSDYWYDFGSSWSLTNPLGGSTSSEQWVTSQSTSGTITTSQTLTFSFQHQYYLTMQSSPSNAGSVTPSSGWRNAGGTVQIQATANSGYFSSWNGAGSSSYSGTSNPVTITIYSSITETAVFVSPAVTLTPTSAPGGKSVAVSGSNFVAGDTSCTLSSSPTGLISTASCTISGGIVSGSFTVASGANGSYTLTVTGNTGDMADAGFTVTAQVTITVSYSVVGGGSPSAPVFHYFLKGVLKSLSLSKVGRKVSVDTGSAWSVTPTQLTGSTSTQRWDSNQALSGTASSATLVFVFYHQTLQKLSYSVNGGGAGYSPPTFQANQFGSPFQVTLASKAVGYWFDYGSVWKVTNSLVGSASHERWYATQATSGTIGSSATLAFTYQHQFYLTMIASPSSAGSVSPNSNWYNAGSKQTIKATAKSGHKFQHWTGSGSGSYSGLNNPATIIMNSAVTETASFS